MVLCVCVRCVRCEMTADMQRGHATVKLTVSLDFSIFAGWLLAAAVFVSPCGVPTLDAFFVIRTEVNLLTVVAGEYDSTLYQEFS